MGHNLYTHAVSKIYNAKNVASHLKIMYFLLEHTTNVSASCQVVNDHFNAVWLSHTDD